MGFDTIIGYSMKVWSILWYYSRIDKLIKWFFEPFLSFPKLIVGNSIILAESSNLNIKVLSIIPQWKRKSLHSYLCISSVVNLSTYLKYN